MLQFSYMEDTLLVENQDTPIEKKPKRIARKYILIVGIILILLPILIMMLFYFLNYKKDEKPITKTSPSQIVNTEQKVPESDTNTSSKLVENRFYKISNGQVIYIPTEEIVKGADAESFEIVQAKNNERDNSKFEKLFFKDKNRLYYPEDQETQSQMGIPDSDPSSFKYLDRNFAYDRNNVYYNAWTVGGSYFIITDIIDTATVKILDSNINADTGFILASHIAIDKNYAYYFSFPEPKIINEADPDTLTLFNNLSSPYTKDKNHVFYEDKILKKLDVETAELLIHKTNPAKKDDSILLPSPYIKDSKLVHYCGYTQDKSLSEESFWEKSCWIVDGANASSFGFFDINISDDIAKDNKYIYSQGAVVKNSDSKTFSFDNEYSAKDKNNLYTYECDMTGCYLETKSKTVTQ